MTHEIKLTESIEREEDQILKSQDKNTQKNLQDTENQKTVLGASYRIRHLEEKIGPVTTN